MLTKITIYPPDTRRKSDIMWVVSYYEFDGKTEPSELSTEAISEQFDNLPRAIARTVELMEKTPFVKR